MPQQYEQNTPLNILRAFFVIACASIGWTISRTFFPEEGNWFAGRYMIGMIVGLCLSIAMIVVEARAPRGFYPGIFAIVFGLLIGFVSSYFFLQGLSLLPHYSELQHQVVDAIRAVTTVFLCYLCVSLFLKSKDEFTFLVPFVRLTQQEYFRSPKVIDTSAIVDGRIAELCRTKMISGPLIVPRFALDELQKLAESEGRTNRARGQRGLDMLQQLQALKDIETTIDEEDDRTIEGAEARTIELARKRGAQIITCDYNLKTMAELHGIRVANLNEVALALKTRVLPGEQLDVHLLREGENDGQAQGFLPDGTMVVVEHARDRIGQDVAIEVTGVIQKPIGNLVFGKIKK